MFVVTPVPEVTESLRGYRLRLAEKNGYPSSKWIVDAMLDSRNYGTRAMLDAAPLGEWAGLSDKQVEALMMLGNEKYRIRGVDLEPHDFQLHQPKVCPLCLADHGWCEAFWDLRFAVACPIHRVLLVDRCDHCDADLTWQRGKVLQCRCGRDLRSLPLDEAPAELCEVLGLLRHFVYRDAGIGRLPQSMAHLRNLGLHRLLRLLSVLSHRVGSSGTKRNAAGGTRGLATAVGEAAKVLANWPLGLHAYLDQEFAPSVRRTGVLPRYSSFLTWLAGIKTIGRSDEKDAFAFLDEEVRRHLVKVLANSALQRCVASGSCAPAAQGRSRTALGGSQPLQRYAAPCRQSGQWVGADSSAPVAPIRAAAKQLGMSVETLKALRDAGAFGLALHVHRHACVSRQAIDRLGKTLESFAAQRAPDSDRPVLTINEAFRKFGALRGERAAFFIRLVECPEWVTGRTSLRGAAGELQVDLAAVEQFFDRIRCGLARAA